MSRSVFFSIVAITLVSGCGGDKQPAATPAPEPTPSAAPVASAEPAPEPKKRKPFEIYSHCSEVVTVVFGENAKAPNAGRRTIAPSSMIEGPRDNDGNQTVWLLDDKGEPLDTKGHVSRGMKRVEVG